MSAMNTRTTIMRSTSLLLATLAALFLASTANATAPGISGPNFSLTAQPAYLNQPDGAAVYSWGYGCNGAPSGFVPKVDGSTDLPNANCPSMQVPGPTLVVTENQSVTVTLTNNLPVAAGNTSILFPGFQVTAIAAANQSGACANPPQGLLTMEVANGCSVTYTFTAGSPGTRAYYSGTQGDLQIEMGLYGAIIVLPANVPTKCTTGLAAQNRVAAAHWGEHDFRLAKAAYDHPDTCYDREYLFQFSEMDPKIHQAALAQVTACAAATGSCTLQVPTEPYHPAYFLVNGRSMPDDMDANYESEYPHQPYNGNPHMHPGEQVLIRVIGQGRWQHPFHEHGNHVRILGRDGNLILANGPAMTYADPLGGTGTGQPLAGPLLFTTTTTPGLAFDGIFYWTGRGLNWDAYAHNPKSTDPNATLPCTPDSNGYNTGAPTAINYYEWCQDHNKPLQVAPFGDVASGGPATLPDPNIFTNGAWYSGSPYLGPDATTRATGPNSVFQPANVQANPANERGFAFMWHSHNEREITTNNVFPGGMLMMMLVDSREFVIDESN
jgi:FtsP/CotA-like multicopper oxidase with cupredoxin domain